MKYFGTNLTEHGHFIWEMDSEMLSDKNINLQDYPIDFYRFRNEKKGTVRWNIDRGHTVIWITGSCKDTRPGCISVFFTEGFYTTVEMKDKILSIPIAKKIIEQMPFEVRWEV